MKTIEEMIAVMQAYADGKKIEALSTRSNKWKYCPHPIWEWNYIDYRIKQEPKYRPYKDAAECFKDVQKHGGWIIAEGQYQLITGIGRSYDPDIVRINESNWRITDLVDAVWADDGSVCGVLKEE